MISDFLQGSKEKEHLSILTASSISYLLESPFDYIFFLFVNSFFLTTVKHMWIYELWNRTNMDWVVTVWDTWPSLLVTHSKVQI